FDHVLSVISEAAADQKPLRQFARELVRGMIGAHSVHPTLHQVLLDEAPGDRGSRAAHASFQARYLERYAAAVAQYRRRRKDTETMARVLSSAIEGVIHNAARRNMLDAP
ncbi:TetR/AcrR family transcriptional regulator, partial [Mesorhizobium sp. M1C.F.Ca.ET.144.01.1.1]